MLTNDAMKAGRFLRLYKARKKVAAIKAHLAAGGDVMVVTATKANVYGPKWADYFKATKTGVYVVHGKRWDCIDYATVRLA